MNPDQRPCPRCEKRITYKNLARHLKQCTRKKRSPLQAQKKCPNCHNLITIPNMNRHLKKCIPGSFKRKHGETTPSTVAKKPCQDHLLASSSAQSYDVGSVRSSVVSEFNPVKSTSSYNHGEDILDIKEIEGAFKKRMKTYMVENDPKIKDPVLFLERARELIADKIKMDAEDHNIKVNFVLLAEFKKPINHEQDLKVMNFKSMNTIILPTTNIKEYVIKVEKKLLAEMEEFYAKGSGWTLNKILSLELRVNRYLPLRGSTYIELPKAISSKRAVLNIMNNDQKCFLWSILAALHTVSMKDHPYRVHHYQSFEHELDEYFDGIVFPVGLDRVKCFEKRSSISINVYTYDKKCNIYPLIITDNERERHVDLLYVRNDTHQHYCLIKNLGRLVGSQTTKYEHKVWFCKRCLTHLGTEELLKKHRELCYTHEAVRTIMPEEGSFIKFHEFHKTMRVPFVAYADFECLLKPIHAYQPPTFTMKTNQSGRIEFQKETSYTYKYQKHEAINFSYYISYSDGDYQEPINYFGTDAAQIFVESLLSDSKKIHNLYLKDAEKPMKLTTKDIQVIATTKYCHICRRIFEEDDIIVRDHDHLTGRFRGVAHNSCNLNFRKPSFIPVFIHNLSGYDTHLFIKMFGLNNENIKVIPNNEERYISYTIEVEGGVQLRFLDSLRFMASSLDSLVKNLSADQFKHTSKYYHGEQLQLLLKKGIYPYDFMDCLEKYEMTSLPPKEAFFNKLNMHDIKDEDYEHAVKVWNNFNVRNMKEYTQLYNQSDVLLLADVMENFRDVCMQTYQLDPAWYYTAPGLAWSAMLKTTDFKLDLLTDYEMVLMIGKGVRGGVSQCSNRYAKANNPYAENFETTEPTTYLTYLDANNLYAWAMNQYMPYSNFKWVENCSSIDVTEIPDNAITGYILEVDLHYPREIHDLHSDLPLAPERKTPPGSKEEKLLTTLYDKEKYVVHYRNLKQYLSLGMKVKKIHRAISFSQKDWLKPYIDLNTNMRKQATNGFEKDFFKLMNNSVFGKTLENIRNRVDIRLATRDKQVEKWMAQTNFKSRTIFTEQLAAIHMKKTKLLFNKPIYLGMSILDVSKTLIYDFHYNVIKNKYKDKAQLQYTDTDSLTYLIETDNFYVDMSKIIDKFDTSDYPQPNRYKIPRVNKKVLGKMKDELNGRIMYEHVGLRSKMYASRYEKTADDSGEVKKSKGVKKSVVKDNLTFDDYKATLLDRTDKYRSINMIRSYNHDLFSVQLHKIVLSAADDKRYIMQDGIRTLPWGHYAISEDMNTNLQPTPTTE